MSSFSKKTAACLLVLFVASNTLAAQNNVNTWICSMDAAGNVPQAAPPVAAQVKKDIAYMAPQGSQYEVYLARGGRTGMFVYAHLHGIHNARRGETHYSLGGVLRDASGYTWAVMPGNRYTVRGTSKKPDRHGHCSIQWDVPVDVVADIERTTKSGNAPNVFAVVQRDRESMKTGDILGFATQLSSYLTGGITPAALLTELNKGKVKP